MTMSPEMLAEVQLPVGAERNVRVVRSVCSRLSWRCDAALRAAPRRTRVPDDDRVHEPRRPERRPRRPASDGAGNEKVSSVRMICGVVSLTICRSRRSAPRRPRRPAASRSSARSCPAGTGSSVQHFVKAGARRRALRIDVERLARLGDRLFMTCRFFWIAAAVSGSTPAGRLARLDQVLEMPSRSAPAPSTTFWTGSSAPRCRRRCAGRRARRWPAAAASRGDAA